MPFYTKDTHTSFGKHVLTPSLALTSVAAATPAEWTVAYWDENLLQGPPPATPFPQVVGISVHVTFVRRACELAAWYRAHGAVIVMGGLHVSACAAELAEHADVVAIGHGVQLWPRILRDIEAGHAKRRYEADFRTPYAEEPAPRRSLVPRAGFLTTTSLMASRGCHNRCDFCFLATDGVRMPYQTRTPEQVVAEIEADDQPYAVFVDNNLGSRPEYLRRLCAALEPLQRIWSAAVSLDVTDDPTLVREMALAGCTGVFIGFETLSDANLRAMGKTGPSVAEYGQRVALLHDHGIQVNGSFVFGFDHDDAGVFERTVAWVEDQRLECATFHILTPYPGTPLFAELAAAGRLLHRDWARYDTAHAVFRPQLMTPEQLEAGYAWSYKRLFSMASIWRRRPADWQAVPAYLAMSCLYKRSNALWHFLIRHQLTARAWRPLVECTRRRHLRFRRRLAAGTVGGVPAAVVSAGV